jgi:ureidoglycolate lyase
MVVVGERDVDFVVVQYANGVELEDCQEVILEKDERGGGEGLVAEIEEKSLGTAAVALKARL